MKDAYKLSNKSRPKPVASHEDVEEYLRFLWIEDTHAHVLPITKAQIACFLLMLTFAAARPGAVVVSDCYRNSNEALTFGVRGMLTSFIKS